MNAKESTPCPRCLRKPPPPPAPPLKVFGMLVVECDTLPEECRGDLVIGSWVDRYPLKMELQGGKIVGVIQPKVTT